jgi:hypothetical protein
MVQLIHRRQALIAIGAGVLLGAPALIPSPARSAPISAAYGDFTGVWLVDRRRGRRGPEGRRRPPPNAPRNGGFGPGGPRGLGGSGGPGGPEGEDVKIEGVNVPGLDRGDRRTYDMMTDAGKAAFAAMNPLDLPANNCKSPGLPSIAMTPNLQDWRQSGDVLTIHHEYYDTVREIRLDRRSHPAAVHTPAGDAVSWMDGDTLVIETTNLTAMAGGLGRNAPGSDARTVVERYRLSPDKQTLDGEITLNDPKYLTRPMMLHVAMTKQPEGTKIETFPCSIESARDYLGTK